jgi:hypothetical protein
MMPGKHLEQRPVGHTESILTITPDIRTPGVPAFAGWIPVGAVAYCRERLIRLKPGLLTGDIWMKHSTFISQNSGSDVRIISQTSSADPGFLRLRRGRLLSFLQIMLT